MKIHVASDLHLELQSTSLLPYPADEADVIVLAGDIGSKDNGVRWAAKMYPGKPVVYVIGNHESYGHEIDDVTERCRQSAAETNIRVLENDEIILDVIRFLGCTLWTDFRLFGNGKEDIERAIAAGKSCLNDFRYIRTQNGLFTPEQSIDLHRASRAWLEAKLDEPFDGKTVVVTHHAPSFKSVIPRFQGDIVSACFASNLDALVERADLWIHGHTHAALDYGIGKCRVICNPQGYRYEPTGYRNDLIVEVEP